MPEPKHALPPHTGSSVAPVRNTSPRTEWEQVAVYDWVQLDDDSEDDRLHALGDLSNCATADTDWIGYGTTRCGLESVTGALMIPGMLSRMGAPRCETCCEMAGLPKGVGSPKNDPALRPLVGLGNDDEGGAQ